MFGDPGFGYLERRWLAGLIPGAAFLWILWMLLEPKCTRRTARLIGLGFLAAELAVQWGIHARYGAAEQVFTLMPLTLCVPAIVGVHLLSKNRFVPTAAGWLLALLARQFLLVVQKLLMYQVDRLENPAWEWVMCLVLLAAAAVLVWITGRFFQEPFRACAGELDGSWLPLLCFLLMLLALHSYFRAEVTNVTVLGLLLLTAAASFGTLVQMMNALPGRRQARESRLQMEALRQDCALLQRKLELGRGFRHDMRHHVLALSALLQQGDCGGALRYVEDWQGQLTQVENRSWCRSTGVDAVLSAYHSQAEEAGCCLEAEVSLAGKLPVEELDLCVVLANALENAIHACREMPEGAPREIRLELALTKDGRRLTLHIRNSCARAVDFDSRGFPVVEYREGHGQGMKSIAAVAEKYHGMFQCGCDGGSFDLRVVLLDAEPAPQRGQASRAVATAVMSVFVCLFLLNCVPTLAQALEAVPVLGRAVKVVDLRSYAWFWGGTGMSVEEPVLEGEGAEAADAEKDAFIAQMREVFLDNAARRYQGYAAEDVSYEVVRDDSALLVLRFDATLNAGGSMDYHHHVVLDRETGEVLSLADLFVSGANYVFPISREIRAQMEEQVRAGEGDYFLPGGIWSEEECFQSIDPEQQDFYIDADGGLVIAFAEYEVAPGSMGSPEFSIPTDVLEGILARPSLLR